MHSSLYSSQDTYFKKQRCLSPTQIPLLQPSTSHSGGPGCTRYTAFSGPLPLLFPCWCSRHCRSPAWPLAPPAGTCSFGGQLWYWPRDRTPALHFLSLTLGLGSGCPGRERSALTQWGSPASYALVGLFSGVFLSLWEAPRGYEAQLPVFSAHFIFLFEAVRWWVKLLLPELI